MRVRNRFRPHLEQLEGRDLPSALIGPYLEDPTLEPIFGSPDDPAVYEFPAPDGPPQELVVPPRAAAPVPYDEYEPIPPPQPESSGLTVPEGWWAGYEDVLDEALADVQANYDVLYDEVQTDLPSEYLVEEAGAEETIQSERERLWEWSREQARRMDQRNNQLREVEQALINEGVGASYTGDRRAMATVQRDLNRIDGMRRQVGGDYERFNLIGSLRPSQVKFHLYDYRLNLRYQIETRLQDIQTVTQGAHAARAAGNTDLEAELINLANRYLGEAEQMKRTVRDIDGQLRGR